MAVKIIVDPSQAGLLFEERVVVVDSWALVLKQNKVLMKSAIIPLLSFVLKPYAFLVAGYFISSWLKRFSV